MEIKQIAIYESIKHYLESIPVVCVQKGRYIATMESGNVKQRYYIVKGHARIVKHVEGREMYIDEVGEDEFTGALSRVHSQELMCDILAVEDTVLLELVDEVFEKLLKDSGFARVFYYKSSQRIYKMYKRMLLNSMFSQTEILAAYILNNEKKGRCVCPNMNVLCEELGFSRRSLYNALNNLIDSGGVEKKGHSLYIKEEETVREKGVHVLEYTGGVR